MASNKPPTEGGGGAPQPSHRPQNSVGSFTTAPEQQALSFSTSRTNNNNNLTQTPLYEDEPQDAQVEAVARGSTAAAAAAAAAGSGDGPTPSHELSTPKQPPASLPMLPGPIQPSQQVAPPQPTAAAAASHHANFPRPPQQQQHVTYAPTVLQPTHSSSRQRTHVPVASASFPPVLPALPGEGHMSGPYPSLRPFSAFEPLQPSLVASSSSPATAFGAAPPPPPVPGPSHQQGLSSSPTSYGPAETSMGQQRQSKSSLKSPGAAHPQDKAALDGGGDLAAAVAASTRPPLARGLSGEVPPRVPEPEICVECMMRDQDMADVDVGPDTWARDSDVDYQDALAAWEEERLHVDSSGVERRETKSSSQHHGGGGASLLHVQAPDSEESGYAASASAASYERVRLPKVSLRSGTQRKMVGPGLPLQAVKLEHWNRVSSPVSNFRWRNLLAYLHEQAQFLDPEAVAEESRRADRRRAASQRARSESQQREAAIRAQERERRRTRSNLASSPNPDPDAQETVLPGSRPKGPKLVSSNSSPNVVQQLAAEELRQGPYMAPELAASNASMPLLQAPGPRRFSSPMPEPPVSAPVSVGNPTLTQSAATDGPLLSPMSLDASISRSYGPRSQSPSGFSERPRSMWSNFSRFKRNNGSMFSLAPSGASVMDMHLGLSVDRHQPSVQFKERHQRAVSQHDTLDTTEDEEFGKRKRKKGIKKLISKLFVGPRSTRNGDDTASSPPLALDLSYLSGDSNEPLEPPAPSYLTASGARHERSASSSSQSSLPHSPKDTHTGPAFRKPSTLFCDQPSSPADSSHMLTTQQLPLNEPTDPYLPHHHHHRTSADKPLPVAADLPASGAVSSQALRREKSLPSLPPDDAPYLDTYVPPLEHRPFSHPYGALSASAAAAPANTFSFDGTRSTSIYDDSESIGGGRKSRARTKIFTRPFMKRKESKDAVRSQQQHHQRPALIPKEELVSY